jgi:transposase
MQAVLKAQINKTDRNDARGIAQMIRAGLYRPVHVKTLRSQKLRMLLTHRKLLQSKAIAIENDLRGTLRNFGQRIGKSSWLGELENVIVGHSVSLLRWRSGRLRTPPRYAALPLHAVTNFRA